jgi:hypothetical protein
MDTGTGRQDDTQGTGRITGEPHGAGYRALGPGLHIGYRRNANGGRWIARIYTGKQTYRVEAFADADDTLDSNGSTVLTFWDAQQRAHELKTEQDRAARGPEAKAALALTVANAVRRISRSATPATRAATCGLTRHVLGQGAVPAGARPSRRLRWPP